MNTQTLVRNPALSTPERPVIPDNMCHECFSEKPATWSVAGKTGDSYIIKYRCNDCGSEWLMQKER